MPKSYFNQLNDWREEIIFDSIRFYHSNKQSVRVRERECERVERPCVSVFSCC